MMPNSFILQFSKTNKSSLKLAGGKGANLGEMYNSGFPVPNGFVITSRAYFHFLTQTSLISKIASSLSGMESEKSSELNRAAKEIQLSIKNAKMPESIAQEILSSYKTLVPDAKVAVAVRSSATAEDLPEASFAGQQDSYLDIKTEDELLKRVQDCWASLFGSRAIYYREQKGFSHFKVGIAVVVQVMVESESSGIMFTVDPLSGNQDHLTIEAGFGLAQPIVSGEIVPDQYVVRKSEHKIVTKNIIPQPWQLINKKKYKISSPHQKQQKLTDQLILELAKIGQKLESHYHKPQDIEWALFHNKLFIVQTRPITTLKSMVPVDLSLPESIPSLLIGLPASPGIATGPVRHVRDPKEIYKVKTGDILLTSMTDPDYVPAMKKAVGIITDLGGRTSHAAIVSRELGIPAIVGTKTATKVLKESQIVTLDGLTGRIYDGDQTSKIISKSNKNTAQNANLKTATKLMVNLADPGRAFEIARQEVDGIGLLRAEFIIAQIGIHPKYLIARGRESFFVEQLVTGIAAFCEAFIDRPVIYRATDFKTNEYRSLKGGDKYETVESNPMLGFRGAFRYLADDRVFNLELEAIKKVREKHKNLQLMIPFVHSPSELKGVKKLISASGLKRSETFKLFLMVELPVNVILLDDFIDLGIDGVSIGSNDLTMTILGVDRDNQLVASAFNEMHPAVLWAIEKTIKTARKRGIYTSICGQAPSVYPELTELLIQYGISAISVNPDAITQTRKLIYLAEQKLLKK